MNDDTFAVLANEHRRELLLALLDENPQDDGIRLQADGGSGTTTPDQMQTAMYHQHLPKLVDFGFVRWNEGTHEVSKGPRFDEARLLLEVVDEPPEN